MSLRRNRQTSQRSGDGDHEAGFGDQKQEQRNHEDFGYELDTSSLKFHLSQLSNASKRICTYQPKIKTKKRKEKERKNYKSKTLENLEVNYRQALRDAEDTVKHISDSLHHIEEKQPFTRSQSHNVPRKKPSSDHEQSQAYVVRKKPSSDQEQATSTSQDHLRQEDVWRKKLRAAETERDKYIGLFNSLEGQTEELARLKEKLSQLESENTRLLRNYMQEKAEKDDALTRLSAVASSKIRDNNPNIADLSDVNRPTKIAEKMSELYDNEWTDAFDSLEKSHPDINVVQKLVNILKNINERCHGMAWQDFFRHVQTAIELPAEVLQELKPSKRPVYEIVLTKEMQQQIKEFRKLRAPTILPIIQKALLSKDADSEELTAYYNKCVEVCWLAAVQDPPLFINFNPGEKFDTTLFKDYTARGPYVQFLVWPALHLHENGPLLSKGVAQGTRDKIQRSVSQKRDAISRQQSEPNAKTHSSIDANLHQSIRNTATESKRATEL